MPTLVVFRDTAFPEPLRAYRVLLDGREIGALKPSDRLSVDIAPGRHVLALRIDLFGSGPVEFEASADVRFAARSNLLGVRMLAMPWFMLFRRDQYLVLERLDSGRLAAQGQRLDAAD